MSEKENFQVTVHLEDMTFVFDLKNYKVKENSMSFDYKINDEKGNNINSGHHHLDNLGNNDTLGGALEDLLYILKIA